MKYLRNILLCVLAATALWSCSSVVEPDYQEHDYGYVQFKVYKLASKAPLDYYLNDVTKIKVTLKYEGNPISQTLVMTSSNPESAEFGLRSDKMKLLAGTYQVLAYSLYNRMDDFICDGIVEAENSVFEVKAGGLSVHDLYTDFVGRGKVRFSLVKDMSAFTETPQTKAAERTYTFDEIETVTITVKSEAGVKTVFEKLPADFSIHFDETDDVEDGYRTSSFVCDTLLTMKVGNYTIESFAAYDTNDSLLEVDSRLTVDGSTASFTVEDNKVVDAYVPVKLHETDEYIKDYYALYNIWYALGGPSWRYIGEDYTPGINWDFNKDPDLWGDQPGVSLHSNGRVAMINLSGFGFYGHMPSDIGQLTELVELYLGTHNDSNLSAYEPGKGTAGRLERHKKHMRSLHPATPMAEPIARALAENQIYTPETELYKTMTEAQLIDPYTGGRIQTMDTNHGKITNGLRSLPAEFGKLTKLEQLMIANSELTALPEEMSKLESLTDLELYNCPNMKEFPMALTKMPALVLVNLANNKQWNADEALKGIKGLAQGPAREKIQILYFNENSLEVIPKEITNMKKLGLLDFSSNNIHTIESAWGNDIKPVQLYLDNNQLSEFPVTSEGVFCFMDDAETFSARNNKFTEFPDIFDAESIYTIVSIDFSYNHISGFQNGENFKGVKVETLTLANNPELTVYPVEIAKSNSTVFYVNLRGCNVDTVPEEAFEYENSIYLVSLDLSYNDLKKLPWSMHAGNLPYLYGVELSYNKFTEFPWEVVDSQYLTVFAMRGQRDDEGKRCFSDWPTGIYQHRGLRGLYLGSNNLKKIDDTISSICYYLDISDNPNIVFDASDICYYIQMGAYILIYDKTQNILNCDILLN